MRHSVINIIEHVHAVQILHCVTRDPQRTNSVFLPRCMECRRGLTMRILSVRLSVCHTRALWQNGRKICPDLYAIRKNIYLVYWEEEWLVGDDPSTWNFGSTDPRWSEIADFQQIIARSSSAVTHSEKSSINANRKSTTRFPMNLRWSSNVAPKSHKGGLKMQNGRFSLKMHFTWRKTATKFLCVKTVSGKVVRHSLA